MTIGEAGSAKIAVIGQHAITPADLTGVARELRHVADADRLARSLVGSSHLAVSVGGAVRLQGTVTGVRRVYHAPLAETTVAASRADVLAFLTAAGIDEGRLALHLLDASVLYPLAGQPVWRGVKLVPTDHYLVLAAERHYSVRWWTPPEPVVAMAEGAVRLREALGAAVDARVGGRALVSCDLGGLDSTALCSLAARGSAHVVAYTAATYDPMGDDVAWAAPTVAGLGSIEHHVIPAAEMPVSYHGLLDQREQFDEPCSTAIDLSRWLTIGQRAAARGSELHLVGFGGDELLSGSPAHLHSLVRNKPRVALRQLRGFAVKYRWPRLTAARQLLDHRPYRDWLRTVADGVTSLPEPLETPLLDWGFQPRLLPWVAAPTVDMVRDQIRAAAAGAEPLSPLRGQHRELETMRALSRLTSQYEQLAARLGLIFAAPYYDDRVIEAGLAVRPEERVTPWRYKPLIIEAMRGIVPAKTLTRQTKANANCEEELGLMEYRADLLALWEDSRLAELGLVDVDRLRAVCSRPLPPELQMGALSQTIACEVWLRALERSSISSQGGNDDVQVA